MSRRNSCLALAAALLLTAGSVEAASPALNLGAPRLVRTAEGVSLRGAVCRTGPVRVIGHISASLDRLNAAGAPVASQPLLLTGAVGGRGPGCGYYDVAVSEDAGRLAVCAVTPEGDRACRAVE